jgi:hypothetical protein
MKRPLCIFLILSILLLLCSCSQTQVKAGEAVTLSFVLDGQNIHEQLTAEETARVITILTGNTYRPIFSGVPSCGFDQNISLTAGGRIYAIARDTCNTIQDLHNQRYFSVSQEDIAYIHSLFEKYGGYFPCV